VRFAPFGTVWDGPFESVTDVAVDAKGRKVGARFRRGVAGDQLVLAYAKTLNNRLSRTTVEVFLSAESRTEFETLFIEKLKIPRPTAVPPCCDTMAHQLTHECPQHGVDCPDKVVVRGSSGRLFLRSPNATYTMTFCPWCGAKVQDLEPDEIYESDPA
jgi:hypothetical protein